MEFSGTKVAIFFTDKLVMQLRDNKANLRWANMWDFPGGGREGNENPIECAIREIQEELGITLDSSQFIWQKEYPAMHDKNQRAYFLVANISKKEVEKIQFGEEGQRWDFMEIQDFFSCEDVVPDLKSRLKDYLDTK